MSYTSGGLIEAADFNGFVSTSANNVNAIWSTGSGDKGYGQSALSTVSVGGTVTATNWASLVNTLASMGSQQSTSITTRTAPVTGNTISVLANVATDINSLTASRGNAGLRGNFYGTWTGSAAKTAATAANAAGWTITFTQTLTFADTNAIRYFFNGGGIVRLDYSKSSTGTDKDPDWNLLASQCGNLNFTGRVAGADQIIFGTTYSGTTRIGGSGGTQTTLATTTGFYNLTAGAAATTIFQLNDAVSPYTGDYIRTTVALSAGGTVLTFTTTWFDAGYSGAGKSNAISGGTDTTSPNVSTTYGTAPMTLLRYFPPSTSFLTVASWGTPTVASSVA